MQRSVLYTSVNETVKSLKPDERLDTQCLMPDPLQFLTAGNSLQSVTRVQCLQLITFLK